MIMSTNIKLGEITEAQATALAYAIRWFISDVEDNQYLNEDFGVAGDLGNEVRSCKAFLDKII